MAENYTDRTGLPLWGTADTFNTDCFNETNETVETKLGHLAREEISVYTATSTSASRIIVPLSNIDWTKYDDVYFDIEMTASTSTAMQIKNQLASSGYSSVRSYIRHITPKDNDMVTTYFAGFDTDTGVARLVAHCMKNTSRIFTCSCYTNQELTLGYTHTTTFADTTDLYIDTADGTTLGTSSIKITICGVR